MKRAEFFLYGTRLRCWTDPSGIDMVLETEEDGRTQLLTCGGMAVEVQGVASQIAEELDKVQTENDTNLYND